MLGMLGLVSLLWVLLSDVDALTVAGYRDSRPTLFLEIIQRVGCMVKQPDGTETQKGGCGGFGKGNFSELFKSIEDFERTLDGTA